MMSENPNKTYKSNPMYKSLPGTLPPITFIIRYLMHITKHNSSYKSFITGLYRIYGLIVQDVNIILPYFAT